MREVITLQFGPFSCHIGARFWNSQHELSRNEVDSEGKFRGRGDNNAIRGRYEPSVLFDEKDDAPRVVAWDSRSRMLLPYLIPAIILLRPMLRYP